MVAHFFSKPIYLPGRDRKCPGKWPGKVVYRVKDFKLYGGERSDLASCLKSDRDLHVYVGLLQTVDKGEFFICPHGWFLQLPFVVCFIIKMTWLLLFGCSMFQFLNCVEFSFKYMLMNSNKLKESQDPDNKKELLKRHI